MSRSDEPRHFVMVEPDEGKTWVYWATPQVEAAWEAPEWPRVSRARSAIQEHSCKDMLAHGALHTNDGRKTMVGPARHQQRAREHLAQALEVAQRRVDKQTEALKAKQDQVGESASQGHGKRLAQRQHASAGLEKALHEAHYKHAQLAEHANALGPPRQRADRDVRKQTMMTCVHCCERML